MDLLQRVLKKIISQNKGLKQGVQDAQILETWGLAVGPQLAKHTRAVQVKGKTLLIEVDHAIWKQELHANKQLALKRFNEKLNEVLGENTKGEMWIEDIFLLSTIQTKSTPRSK